ncbi:hypothetical protein NKI56_19015 [Mesorhizobium sp. M0622]|uniref:hypothetical protein n=1 Tax=Mesorhizobium sp. M0622 TaxID=2956975 RepID=UPI00333C2DC7
MTLSSVVVPLTADRPWWLKSIHPSLKPSSHEDGLAFWGPQPPSDFVHNYEMDPDARLPV